MISWGGNAPPHRRVNPDHLQIRFYPTFASHYLAKPNTENEQKYI